MIDVLDTDWKDAILLELEVAKIIQEQQVNGWLLDLNRCQELIDELNGLIKETDDQILPLTKAKVVKGTEISNPFTKSGNLAVRVVNYFGEDYAPRVKGP